MTSLSKCCSLAWTLALAGMSTLALASMVWWVNLRGAELSKSLRVMLEETGDG